MDLDPPCVLLPEMASIGQFTYLPMAGVVTIGQPASCRYICAARGVWEHPCGINLWGIVSWGEQFISAAISGLCLIAPSKPVNNW